MFRRHVSLLSNSVRANAISAVEKYLTVQEDGFDRRYGQDLIRAVEFKAEGIQEIETAFGLPMTPDVALTFPFHVTEMACNGVGSCHGGVLSSLADVFTTVHLWGLEPGRKHVSVNLELDFMCAALTNTRVQCNTVVMRRGKKLAFTSFSFVDERTGQLLAKGSHTKAYI